MTAVASLGRGSRVVIGSVLLVTLVAGCGGSGGGGKPPTPPPTHHTPTAPSTPSGTPTAPGGNDAAAVSAIKQAYVTFFSGKTGASRKIALVENGPAFSDVINAQAGTSIAEGTTASVGSVTIVSPTSANVVYTVSLDGTPALKNQTGQAVKTGSTWQVSASTFCALLTLEGDAPAFCKTLP